MKRGSVLIIVLSVIILGLLVAGVSLYLVFGTGNGSASTDESFEERGIQMVKTTGDLGFSITYVLDKNKDLYVQDSVLVPGNKYSMVFKGLKGFDEYVLDGSDEPLVDIDASMSLVGDDGFVALNKPDLFGDSGDGILAKSAQTLSFDLNLLSDIREGAYTWEVHLMDARDELNKIVSRVDVQIKN